MEKLVILSLIDHTKYANKIFFEVFGCILYMAQKVVSLSKEDWYIPKKEKIMRSRLDINKYEHLLCHLLDNWIIQEVSFGTRNSKFDNGEMK